MHFSGSCTSFNRSLAICASHNLKGSAFGEGIDCIKRKTSCVSDQSVAYLLPSEALNFSCTIFSYNSLPSLISFFFRSVQYLFGMLLSVKVSIISITEKYHYSLSSFHKVQTFFSSNNLISFGLCIVSNKNKTMSYFFKLNPFCHFDEGDPRAKLEQAKQIT